VSLVIFVGCGRGVFLLGPDNGGLWQSNQVTNVQVIIILKRREAQFMINIEALKVLRKFFYNLFI